MVHFTDACDAAVPGSYFRCYLLLEDQSNLLNTTGPMYLIDGLKAHASASYPSMGALHRKRGSSPEALRKVTTETYGADRVRPPGRTLI